MPDIAAIIRDRAIANGVDPNVLLRIAQNESSLNPNAAASSSSARGLFQFTKPTWSQYGQGDPTDPSAASDAGARLTAANSQALTSAGLPVNPGSIYLAHFAGANGAVKLLQADPSASVASILGQAAVQANPFLRNMTVADLRNWAGRKMGDDAAPQQPAQPPAQFSVPAPMQEAGALPSPAQPAPTQDDGVQQALAAIPGILAQQSQFTPPQMQSLDMPQPIGLLRARAANSPAMQLAKFLGRGQA